MSVTVYGASDDLIEVDGDVSEEFSYLEGDDGDKHYLAFSDGTLLEIEYTQAGVWRIHPISHIGTSKVEIVQAPADDPDNYSDRATIEWQHGSIGWVVHGTSMALRRQPQDA